MTKFILHGGVTRKKSIHNDNFFKEIVKGLRSPVKILDITFARKRKLWLTGFNKDKVKFLKVIIGKKLIFTIADEKPEILRNQIKENNVIFIIGGTEMDCLTKNLKQLKDFSKLIKGKVIAGSSAGAYVLSRYYYIWSRGSLKRGLGILPFKTITHYDKIKSAVLLKRLNNIGKDLKIIKIPETYYKVIRTKY